MGISLKQLEEEKICVTIYFWLIMKIKKIEGETQNMRNNLNVCVIMHYNKWIN